jgi:hypothetical protein
MSPPCFFCIQLPSSPLPSFQSFRIPRFFRFSLSSSTPITFSSLPFLFLLNLSSSCFSLPLSCH